MYKLTFKKRNWIVKCYNEGLSVSRIALAQEVHRSAVYQIIDKYKNYGIDGLKDHKTGRPETVLNNTVVIIILDLRKRFRYGACRIEQLLKSKGFSIRHRQIDKVIVRHGLVEANIKKQKPRKWVRVWKAQSSYD